MKIALLQADKIPEHRHSVSGGDYPQMFTNFFLKTETNVNIDVFNVISQNYPNNFNDYDGFIITGSRATAFVQQPWIKSLENKIKMLHLSKKKLIGTCFGHQIIAQALGGKVKQATKGWNVGMQHIKIINAQQWMKPMQTRLNLAFCHRDHVVKLPKHANLIATNDLIPMQMFVIEEHIWGIQAHPEMLRAHNVLLAKKQKNRSSQQCIYNSDHSPVQDHGQLIAHWMVNFLKQGNL
jgi:GMP synthase-like glutamine amidotransferase